jgi:hypothetical protein
MQDYRAYIFGIDGHRFIRVDGFLSNHSDDTAALNAARQLTDKHDVEVWDGGRLVARLSPNGEVWSPDLAPALVCAPSADTEKNSTRPEPISLSRVSELASAPSSQAAQRAFSAISSELPTVTRADSLVHSIENLDAENTLQPTISQGASHALDLALAICSRDSSKFP